MTERDRRRKLKRRPLRHRRGSVIVLVLVALVVVLVIAAALMDSANASFAQARHLRRVASLRAMADAGAQYGYWEYSFNGQSLPYSESAHTLGPGTFSVSVTDHSATIAGTIQVVSTATVRTESYSVTRIFDTSTTTIPSAPYPLTGFGGKKLVKLQWPSIATATSYNLYRGTKKTTLTLVKTGIASTIYIDSGLKNGTTYYYEITSVNVSGESAPSNEISAKATNALMNVTVTGGLTAIDLTAEGQTDWVHWGLNPMDHDASGGGKISNYTQVGGSGPTVYTSICAYTWSNGSPTASASATKAAYCLSGTSAEYKLTLPADTTTRAARVYLGADNCSTTFTVSISDGSTKNYSSGAINSATHEDGIFNLVYSANSNNQTITIDFVVKKARPKSATPKISLQAATLY